LAASSVTTGGSRCTGVDRLVADKRLVKSSLDLPPSTAEIVRDREELAERFSALGD
jgi:formate C-acetyltransferase